MNKSHYVNKYYLDACSTTPPHPDVIKEITNIQNNFWGNPSSLHLEGIKASEIIELSRYKLSEKFGCGLDDFIFTSGATESINLAIKGLSENISPGRLVISNVEHQATLKAGERIVSKGWELAFWPVDLKGKINLDLLEDFLKPPTKIVSLIWGQNEIGTVQPLKIIGEECRKRDIIFHIDATQVLPHGFFKCNDIYFDMLSASSHKLQGPKGIGFLMCKSHIKPYISPYIEGGNQQYNIRSGTEPVELIAGFTKAIEFINDKIIITNKNTIFPASTVSKMTSELRLMLESDNCFTKLISKGDCLPNHLFYLVKDLNNQPINANRIVHELSTKGVYISRGSACSSVSKSDSYVLKSLGLRDTFLKSGIRISLGPWIKKNDIIEIGHIIKETIHELSDIK